MLALVLPQNSVALQCVVYASCGAWSVEHRYFPCGTRQSKYGWNIFPVCSRACNHDAVEWRASDHGRSLAPRLGARQSDRMVVPVSMPTSVVSPTATHPHLVCTDDACFQVAMGDVAVFGLVFVALDVVDGMLARRSKTGPTRVGAALDVESDSVAVLFLSLAASRKVSWCSLSLFFCKKRFECVLFQPLIVAGMISGSTSPGWARCRGETKVETPPEYM